MTVCHATYPEHPRVAALQVVTVIFAASIYIYIYIYMYMQYFK